MTLSATNSNIFTPNKSLSVQVSLAGLSFLVRSASGAQADDYFNYTPLPETSGPSDLLVVLKKEISQAGLDSNNTASVCVVHSGPEYTAVPSVLFDSRKASDLLKFNTRILSNDFIAWDHIEEMETHLVYIPLVNINNYLFDTFGSFDYFHSTTILLRMPVISHKGGGGVRAWIYVQERHYDLIIKEGDKLLLCNSYSYSTPEDFLYYLLFAFEQLTLDPEEIQLELMGQVDADDQLFRIAYRYVRHVRIVPQGITDTEQVDMLPRGQFLLKQLNQ